MADRASPHERVLVFVPTYNDVEHLHSLIEEVRGLPGEFTVLIVDDGSTPPVRLDKQADSALLFRIPSNLGLGACTHIAFDHALRWRYRSVVRVDADGQHPVGAIPDLLEALDSDGVDMVVAERTNRHNGHGVRSILAKLVRGYLSVISKLMTHGRAPQDVNSGYFAATAHAAEVMNEYQLERYPEPQMYVLACRRELKIKEIPVEQLDRKHGSSSLTINRAALLMYRFSIFVLAELLQRSRIA